MKSLIQRPRRLRRTAAIREMVRETRLAPSDLIYPLFACPGEGVRKEIKSMPGVFNLSVDELVKECEAARSLGVRSIIVFGLPEQKDEQGSDAFAEDGITQRAIRAVKREVKDLVVMADTCLCEYTSHGHCGTIEDNDVANDPTLATLAQTAVSQAQAGADIIAPSGMMDGMAADSAPQFGDRRSYQMDPPNIREALREAELDVEQGADMLMVKPALPYLDVIRAVRERFNLPLAAYQVSGEYAQIKAAGQLGWIDEERVMMESLIAIKRAGADLILTYFAKNVIERL